MDIPMRKKQILKYLHADMMKGCLSLTSRSCGKPTCSTCQKGGRHPIYLFGFSFEGKTKIVSISPKFCKDVQKLIDNWHRHKDLIEELTDINLQLTKKGLLKENDK